MKTKAILCLVLLMWVGRTVAAGKSTVKALSPGGHIVLNPSRATSTQNFFNLADFDAVGDGVTDAGPALQNALNAIAEAGGGTLFVPAGRYAIITPVQKDFTGVASDVTILGVESLTPVPPIDSIGSVLARGLDLVSEFAPQTGADGISIKIIGLQNFTIKDITFIGTPEVNSDALIVLALSDIREATVRHCEFYGLSSLNEGGAIVESVRSRLNIEQSVFLGDTCNSGINTSVVQNIEWKSVTIADTVFVDYGNRPELYGKLGLSTPFSWVSIGNAAAASSDSPRREAVIRNVFFDEGAFIAVSVVPYRYLPASAPIDLLYVSGMYMNVSNLNAWGNYLYGTDRVLIEKAHYGWSHAADAAINLVKVGNAILDQVDCVETANRIRADATTGKLTIINSVYTFLDSQSPQTRVITTETPEDDPVQYVRQQFNAMLGREPDPAAHFYWSDRLLQCDEDLQCTADQQAALSEYLNSAPSPNFSISGKVKDESGAGLPGVFVTLGGSQSVSTETGADGAYFFAGLPTSGVYTVTPNRIHYTFVDPGQTIVTPSGNQIADFAAILDRHTISGHLTDADAQPLAGATVTLSGSQSDTTTTNASGDYSFTAAAEGNYTITPSLVHYTFAPTEQRFNAIGSDHTADFVATRNRHTITVRIADTDGNAMPGVALMLSGSQEASGTTDASGLNIFSGLPAGGNYTIVPVKQNYSFSPASVEFSELQSDQTVTFIGALVSYTLSGSVIANGQGVEGATVTLGGSQSDTATTNANGTYSFNLSAGGTYTLVPAKTNYLFSPASMTFNDLENNQVADFEATLQTVLEFSAASYSVSEGTRIITVTVNRGGDTSGGSEVIYSAIDGSAEQRSDVIPVIGRLSFAAGESNKSFIVFITDDAYVEGDESITLNLSDLVGCVLGNNSTATLNITDNDSSPTAGNPIDTPRFFVRQQYRDFLNRPPDADGLDFWTNQITTCGTDADCIADRRMNVSAAFFLSIEFQQTGFLAYRLYQSSFGQPPRHLEEFLLDTRTIGEGVVVNAPGWQALLEANKTAFIDNFVARLQFRLTYPLSLTPAEFVNLLNSKTGDALSPNDVAAAVEEFNGAATSDDLPARARVLRRVAENETFSQRQLNPAFVLMQYFGYLQRNPSDTPDTNLDGYNFWLHKLEEFGGDFRRAEMVKSFLVSSEYRARFGTP